MLAWNTTKSTVFWRKKKFNKPISYDKNTNLPSHHELSLHLKHSTIMHPSIPLIMILMLPSEIAYIEYIVAVFLHPVGTSYWKK